MSGRSPHLSESPTECWKCCKVINFIVCKRMFIDNFYYDWMSEVWNAGQKLEIFCRYFRFLSIISLPPLKHKLVQPNLTCQAPLKIRKRPDPTGMAGGQNVPALYLVAGIPKYGVWKAVSPYSISGGSNSNFTCLFIEFYCDIHEDGIPTCLERPSNIIDA